MEKRAEALGPTGERVSRRLRQLRRAKSLTLSQVAEKLAGLGRPIVLSSLSKIETGQRRVDTDDLVALALALDVSPNEILLPDATGYEPEVKLTERNTVDLADAWRWASNAPAPPKRADTNSSMDDEVRSVLVVLSSFSSVDRTMDVVSSLDNRAQAVFTISQQARFTRPLSDHLHTLGADVIPWHTATSRRWDAVVATDHRGGLDKLSGPVLLLPHGFSGEADLDDGSLPDLIGLRHEEQRKRLSAKARDRAVVMGDVVMDRLRANLVARHQFRDKLGIGDRSLVLVGSAHDSESPLENHRGLVNRLMGTLPADEYRVALMLHPNMWAGESKLEILLHLRDAIDSGLLIVDPDSWQSTLIASDLLVGDHGTVSNYAAALGVPVLLEADSDGDLQAGVDDAISNHVMAPAEDGVDALKITRNALYQLMHLTPPAVRPRVRRIAEPAQLHLEHVTAYRATAEVEVQADSTTCRMRRYPAAVLRSGDLPASFLVVTEREVDRVTRDNAEIVIHSGLSEWGTARAWLDETHAHHPGAALAAAATDRGHILSFRDGSLAITSTSAEVFAVAAAAYQLRLEGRRLDGLEFVLSIGIHDYQVTLEALTG